MIKQTYLITAVVAGLTQVCQFSIKQHGPSLLLQSVTHVQMHHHSQHQVGKWLSQVWNILQHLNLQSVEHIPLLPISQPPQAKGLTSLTSPVVVQHNNCQLSRAEVEVLALLGVVVVSALPSYIKHIELQGYLYSSDRHGTTQAFDKVGDWKEQCDGYITLPYHITPYHHDTLLQTGPGVTVSTSWDHPSFC